MSKKILSILKTTWRAMARRINMRYILIAAGAMVFVAIATYTVNFFLPRTVVFSYSQPNCFFNPVLLPQTVEKQQSKTYKVSLTNTSAIGSFQIYSPTTCVALAVSPKESTRETVSLEPFGNGFAKKEISVSAGQLPRVNALSKVDAPIATKQPLTFKLSTTDTVFTYNLVANDKKIPCPQKNRQLACSLEPLNLAQSTTYEVKLERLFNNKPSAVIFTQSIKTVEAIGIVATSIAAGEKLYGVPTDIIVTLNKPITTQKGVRLLQVIGDKRSEMPITTTIDTNKIIVHLGQPLPRSATFELQIEHAESADGGYLPAPHTLSFSTSGGPKVLGVNIGSYKVSPNSSVTVTFDSAVSTTQNLQDFIHIETGAGRLAASIIARGRSVTITPLSSLGHCNAFTVRVVDGLQSDTGVSGGSGWKLASRTICQTSFSIGSSVNGRSIMAYRFGSGSSKIMYVGTTHGDERSSTYTLNAWVEYLEANAPSIPAHRTIIVIPNVNPDGYAAGRRTNANNVDLNRNFPANNWKSGVTMQGGTYLENGGGTAALSEPESASLASYVLSQSPRLVLTYHAVGPLVAANGSGDSQALANIYGDKVGFPSYGSDAGGSFDYDTTGAFEDWLHDKQGVPALLVELGTKSSNEFYNQKNAMWYITQLP